MTANSLKDLAIGFLTTVVAGDVGGAYDQYVGAGFRHHNPYFPGDAASLRKGMADDEPRCPGKQLIVVNALEDGDRVAVHSKLIRHDGNPEMAVVHLFRFEKGRIVELWDVAMVPPAEIVNQHGMF